LILKKERSSFEDDQIEKLIRRKGNGFFDEIHIPEMMIELLERYGKNYYKIAKNSL